MKIDESDGSFDVVMVLIILLDLINFLWNCIVKVIFGVDLMIVDVNLDFMIC